MRYLAAALAAGLLSAAPAAAQHMPDDVVLGTLDFEMREIVSGLGAPWEIVYGPDDHLWTTERVGTRISRINPETGEQHVLIEIDEAEAPGGQDGLLGLALHPELLEGTGNDYVYTAYTYSDPERGAYPHFDVEGNPHRYLYAKIVRLTYDADTDTLGEPVEIIAGLPASNDHNSGRLQIGPDGMVYYTIGDGGKGQLGNWCVPIEAQRLPTAAELEASDYASYQGKVLRLTPDGTIPEDNPEIDGLVSHIYSYGHRNPQGLGFGPDGTLYSSEHGPKSDDEVNIIVAGGNYGWPRVAGFRDDMAYQFARWSDATTPCAELEFSDITIDPSVPVEDETSWTEPMQNPLAALFTVPSDWNFVDPACGGIDFICWPTVAPSSLEVYTGEGIPAWSNSIVLSTLKHGSIYVLPLSEDGQSLRGPVERYFQSENRFRDIAFSPDGLTLYVATDPGGVAASLEGGTTFEMQNPGAILAFTYRGDEGAADGDDAAEAEAVETDTTAMNAADTGSAPVFTEAQAASGEQLYAANCASCHGANLTAANYAPPLAGTFFAGRWDGRTVGELLAKVQTMPPSRPGQMEEDQYRDMTAHILAVNGYAAGAIALTSDPDALSAVITQ